MAKTAPEPTEPATPPPDEDVPRWVGAQQTTCLGCARADNHPKTLVIHNIGTPEEYAVRWHHDCRAIATGDEYCQAVVDQSGGAKGHELRVFLHGDPESGAVAGFVDPTTAEA